VGHAIRRAHYHCIGYVLWHDRRRVDSDHRVLARGGIGPLYDFVRFDQAIELR